MSVVIPTLNDPFYSIRINLDNNDYTLDFKYSSFEERWYMDILDSENVPVLLGIKLVCLYPLAAYQQLAYAIPPGVLTCASGTTDNSPPTLNDLGINRRCQLVYYSEDEA